MAYLLNGRIKMSDKATDWNPVCIVTKEDSIKDLDNKHIDHIIPSSLYKNENELIKKGFNLRNLRLIDSKENIIKNNKLDIKLIKKHKIFDLLPKGHYYAE